MSPPKTLVELFDLVSSNEKPHWSAISRWLKYEQIVEGVDNTWSRPRVALVSHQDVIYFRQILCKGIVLLDPDVRSFNQITQVLTNKFVSEFHLQSDHASRLVHVLSHPKLRYDENKTPFQNVETKFKKTPLAESASLSMNGKVSKLKTDLSVSENRPNLIRRQTLLKQITTFSFESENPIEAILGEDAEASQIFTGCLPGESTVRFAMVRLSHGLYLPELMDCVINVRVLFFLIGPKSSDMDYIEVGRAIGTMMSNKKFRDVLLKAECKEVIINELNNYLNETLIIPPGDIDKRALFNTDEVRKALKRRKISKNVIPEMLEVLSNPRQIDDSLKHEPESDLPLVLIEASNPLQRTGRPFGGLINDLKNRLPFYIDDYKSAMNFQCITSTIFIFFANFASAVAFGDVIGHKTSGLMGVTEILISHGICNIVWGLIGGQPICILASVGPFLVFESSLYTLCNNANLDFLAVKFWIGLWTFMLMILCAMVEAPFLMKYMTRFTEDIFTGLIAVIFIWEPLKYLRNEFYSNPIAHMDEYCRKDHVENCSALNLSNWQQIQSNGQPDTALLALIFVTVTFVLAYSLKRFRNSVFFGQTIRRALGDFGVSITVIVMTLIDHMIFDKVARKHVQMPLSFRLTNTTARTWLVHPFGTVNHVPSWVIAGSVLPAVLVAILLFAEVEIIEGLLFKKERRLKKPAGFHWDLVVIGALTLLCSIFGLQWMCPAAVQTLSHVNSLTIMKKIAPGESPKIDYVIEQRVTVMLIGCLHVAAAFGGKILNLLPTSLLFGLFLYLGVVGLNGIQFYRRLILIFTPRKCFPSDAFCSEVSTWRMHFFTFMQLIGFVLLWSVNLWPYSALAFPFILILIAVFRKSVMPLCFSKTELRALDENPEENDDEKSVKEDDDEKDFYEQASKPV